MCQQSRDVPTLLTRQSESNICNHLTQDVRRIYLPTLQQTANAELTPKSTRAFWWNHPPPSQRARWAPQQGAHSLASADLLCEVRRILSLAEMSFGWAGRPLGSLPDVSPDGSRRRHTRGKGHRSHRSAGLDPVSAYRVSLSRITVRSRQLGGMI